MSDYLTRFKNLKFTVLPSVPPVAGVDNDGFFYDAAQFRFAFTDGCTIWNSNGDPASGAGVFFNDQNPSNESVPLAGKDPLESHPAEVRAAIVAMNAAKAEGKDKVIIVTDSDYLEDALTNKLPQWLVKWPQTGLNKHMESLFKELIETMEGIEVELVVIKSHTNTHIGNEQADWMALQAAYMYQIKHNLEPGSGSGLPSHYDHQQRFVPVFGVIGNSANAFVPPWSPVSPVRGTPKRGTPRGSASTPVAGSSAGNPNTPGGTRPVITPVATRSVGSSAASTPNTPVATRSIGSSAAVSTPKTPVGTRPVIPPVAIRPVGTSTSVGNARKVLSFEVPAANPPIPALQSSSPDSPTLPASSSDDSALPSSSKRPKLESTLTSD